jgi:hypothetical protein
VLGIRELGQRHQERAASALVGLHLLGEGVEHGQDLIPGQRSPGPGGGVEPLPVEPERPLDVRGDQLVLGGEEAVERGRRDARFGGHPVHPGGSDAVPVEQLVRDLEHVFPGLLG